MVRRGSANVENAELLVEGKLVNKVPGLGDSAVFEAEDDDCAHVDPVSRCRDTEIATGVGAMVVNAKDNAIVFCDRVEDFEAAIGDGGAHPAVEAEQLAP